MVTQLPYGVKYMMFAMFGLLTICILVIVVLVAVNVKRRGELRYVYLVALSFIGTCIQCCTRFSKHMLCEIFEHSSNGIVTQCVVSSKRIKFTKSMFSHKVT